MPGVGLGLVQTGEVMDLGETNSSLLYLWGGYQGDKARLYLEVSVERTRDSRYKLKQDTQSGYKEKGFPSEDSHAVKQVAQRGLCKTLSWDYQYLKPEPPCLTQYLT